MKAQTRTWVALAVVFVSGTVIGFFSGQAYLRWRVQTMMRRGPAALQEFMVKRIAQQLHPTDEQMPTIKNILHRVAWEMDERRQEHSAELWRSIERGLAQMQPVLTAEQQQVLDQMSMEDLMPGPGREATKPPETDTSSTENQ